MLSLVIGLDEIVDKVLRNLQNNSLYILGVVGIGKIGKTTLVKKLYYQIQGEFQNSIFWENVKSMVVKHVEKQLLKYLCGMELDDIRNFRQHLKECWMEKKVFVVMDDVNGTQSISELLCIDLDIIKNTTKGSKIILMSCNWQDLKNVVFNDGKFEIELLKNKQTMEFFSMKVFQQSKPPISLKSIIEKVVNACNGLPLSLEVMGSWLYGNDSLEVC